MSGFWPAWLLRANEEYMPDGMDAARDEGLNRLTPLLRVTLRYPMFGPISRRP